jgi:hypothetical protein
MIGSEVGFRQSGGSHFLNFHPRSPEEKEKAMSIESRRAATTSRVPPLQTATADREREQREQRQREEDRQKELARIKQNAAQIAQEQLAQERAGLDEQRSFLILQGMILEASGSRYPASCWLRPKRTRLCSHRWST